MNKGVVWLLSICFILIVTHHQTLLAEENNIKKGISSFTPQSKFSLKNNRTAEVSFSKCSTLVDKEIKIACKRSFLKEFSNYEFELNHRENVLKWQHLSTQIILFVVLVLVSLGLYFAWVQFHSDTINQEKSELELSVNGVKMSSPVLGVIILTLSLGFFYLYLVYVYPITII